MGVPASGIVAIPGLAFSAPFNVTPGAVTKVALPLGADLSFTSDQITNRGIHVQRRQSLVYGVNRR
jgi:hypothetical protein